MRYSLGRNSLIAPLIFFFISPALFLPFVVSGVRKGERWAVFLFALFLGLWAWLTIPFADLFRHNEHYLSYLDKPYEFIWAQYFLENETVEYDFIIPTISWFMVNNGIPFQYLRFFEAILSCLMLYNVFDYMVRHSKAVYSKADVWKRLLILFLFYELMYVVCGVRYGMALCLFIYGFHCFCNRKNYVLGTLFYVLAIGTHTSLSVIVPLSIIGVISIRNRKMALVALALATPIMGFLMSEYSSILGIRAKWYLDEGNSLYGEGYEEVTSAGLAVMMIWRLPSLFFAYVAWKYFDKKSIWSRVVLLWALLTVCLSMNSVLLIRVSWLLGAFGIFALIDLENNAKMSNNIIMSAIVAGMLSTLGGIVNNKTILYYSHYEYLVKPIPVILTHQYTEGWMRSHIDNNTVIRDTRGDFILKHN